VQRKILTDNFNRSAPSKKSFLTCEGQKDLRNSTVKPMPWMSLQSSSHLVVYK
jgi:hypothetical protein